MRLARHPYQPAGPVIGQRGCYDYDIAMTQLQQSTRQVTGNARYPQIGLIVERLVGMAGLPRALPHHQKAQAGPRMLRHSSPNEAQVGSVTQGSSGYYLRLLRPETEA